MHAGKNTFNSDKLVSRIYREVIRDPRKALMLSQKGLTEARKRREPAAVAKMTLAMAHCLREVGRYSEALRQYSRAARLFRQEKMNDESWRTSIGKMDALDQMGRYAEALRLAVKTSHYFRTSGKPFWEAKIHANTGNIYQHLDQYDLALKYYKKAYVVLSSEQPTDGYILLFNQATSHLCSGNPAQAVELMQKCLDYFQDQNLSSFLARTHYNISYGFYLQGKYQDALLHLAEARNRLVRLKDWSFLSSCYLDEAEIYLRLNQVDDAIVRARKARRRFSKLRMPYELAESNSFIGIALIGKERISAALPFLREARSFFEHQGNQIKSAEMDSHLALAFLKQKRWAFAKSHLLNAYEKFSRAKIYSRMLFSITYLAELELKQGNVADALKFLNRGSGWTTRVHLPWVLLPYYQTLGRAQLISGVSGRKSLDRAIRLIESMRSEIPAEDLRISYFKDKLAPYHMLIHYDLRSGLPGGIKRSFEYTERARSRVLQDLLEGSLRFEGLDAELNAIRSESWRRTLSVTAEPQTRKKDQASEQRILQILRRAQRLYKPKRAQIPKIHEIQKMLIPGQTILSYYRIDDFLHAYLIDSSGITAFSNLARNSELIASWHFLRFQLERARTEPEKSLEVCNSHLYAIYQKLFAPLVENLAETRVLTIIPHGWLHAFPFHCLRDETSYLAERFQFSYAPSVSIYAHCHYSPFRNNRVLVMGHSDSHAPWINQEIDEMQKLFPEAHIVSGDAARSEVLFDRGPDADIIHIACHGRFLQNQPFLSGIHLADGWLTLPQIYQMRLRASLITLSGCETGSNEVTVGDELVGLTRGFLYAGTSTLQVSLWRVFDASTAHFMKCFYSALSSGSSPIQSWQQALLLTKEKWPHPYFWGPFVLMGRCS